MADYNSSLPIRTESAGDAIVKVADATTPSQQLKVNADGSIDTNFVPGAAVEITDGTDTLEVNADGSINSVVTATNLDIRDLAFATDKVDVSGSSVTVTATNLDIRDLAAATDSVSAWLKDESGNAYSNVNPLPVAVVDTEGTEICDYNTATAVASGATSNHDYTTAASFRLGQVWASASGKMKIEIQVETAAGSGTFNTKFVGFSSTANPNIDVPLSDRITVASGAIVRVIRTNLDNQAQNLYSSILGF